jgi:ABC-2 type transport system permease protein
MIGRGTATLVGHLWRQHRRPLVPMAIGLALFEFVITQFAPAPNEVGWLGQIFSSLPSQVRALMDSDLSPASPIGVIAIGYTHPFFLVLLAVWAIRIPSAALAGEIGRGTMDLVASRPVRRQDQVMAAALSTAGGLAVLVLAAWTGTAIGLSLRDLDLHPRQFAGVASMACFLYLTWGAVSLFVSATQREAGPAIAWTAGIMAATFVIEYLARLWTPIAWLRPFSPFAWYRASHIIAHGIVTADVVRLTALAVIAAGGALLLFSRRDL